MSGGHSKNRRQLLKLTGSVVGTGVTLGTVRAATADFVYPCSGRISQWYHGGHPAVDIANVTGTPLYAAHQGVATTHIQKKRCGRYVKIDHGNTYETVYCHMSDWDVADGQQVSRGAKIGEVGTTGHTTGPHVHFKIKHGGGEVYVPAPVGETVDAGDPISKDYPNISGESGPPPTQPGYGGGGGDGGGGGGSSGYGHPAQPKFNIEDIVEATANLNVREGPGLGSPTKATVLRWADGIIIDGPEVGSEYVWWGIHWDDHNVAGWSAQNYLRFLPRATAEYDGGSGDDESGEGECGPSDGAETGGGGTGDPDHQDETISMNDIVLSTSHLNTRDGPDTCYHVVYTAPPGTVAEVVSGPVEGEEYTWWGLWWPDAGLHGFSVERHLTVDPGVGTGTFSIGDDLESTTQVNVRDVPGLAADKVHTAADGAAAEVVNGPVAADGFTWWGLHWKAADIWGWSAERYLKPAGSPDGGSGESDDPDGDIQAREIWTYENETALFSEHMSSAIKVLDAAVIQSSANENWAPSETIYSVPIMIAQYGGVENHEGRTNNVRSGEIDLDWQPPDRSRFMLWADGEDWNATTGHTNSHGVIEGIEDLVLFLGSHVSWTISGMRYAEWIDDELEVFGPGREEKLLGYKVRAIYPDFDHGATGILVFAHIPEGDTVQFHLNNKVRFRNLRPVSNSVQFAITPHSRDNVETKFDGHTEPGPGESAWDWWRWDTF